MGVKLYDTVILLEPIGDFPKGEKGAVVEIYTTPYRAFDIEIITDDGETKGLLEAVHPEQIRLILPDNVDVRFAAIQIEADGARAEIRFLDGTQVTVQAEDLYALAN